MSASDPPPPAVHYRDLGQYGRVVDALERASRDRAGCLRAGPDPFPTLLEVAWHFMPTLGAHPGAGLFPPTPLAARLAALPPDLLTLLGALLVALANGPDDVEEWLALVAPPPEAA